MAIPATVFLARRRAGEGGISYCRLLIRVRLAVLAPSWTEDNERVRFGDVSLVESDLIRSQRYYVQSGPVRRPP